MRSRAARLTLSALAWLALGAAAFFTYTVQQQIDLRRTSLRAFEATSREAADTLDDVQAGQQAYVAVGQDAREWAAKVATFLQNATSNIDTLRASAQSAAAGPLLLDASTAATQIGTIDKRVRERLSSDDAAGASDIVFSEGADAISSAVSNVDAALTAELQSADAFDTQQRRAQVYALGGVAGLVAIILAMLGIASPGAGVASAEEVTEEVASESESFATLAHQAVFDREVEPPAARQDGLTSDALKQVAELCTDFGRVQDASGLKVLLERAAGLLNARGLIVWLGDTAGSDLRPVLAHGYSDATLSRIATVSRAADNAAAAAYRTGETQIVHSKPGAAQGAIVAPLLAASGCIGALTAEIRDRGEELPSTRALSAILSAQLAGVLATAAEAPAVDSSSERQPAAG